MDQVNVAGIEMDLEVQGEGPPLLYLHPEHYAHLHAPFLSKLSRIVRYMRHAIQVSTVVARRAISGVSMTWPISI